MIAAIGEIVLVAGLSLAFLLAIVCVPALSARLEIGRLRRRYQLTDQEIEMYMREFPEVCHAVGESLGGEASSREIKRIASESAIMAIQRQRQRRRQGGTALERDPAAGLEAGAEDSAPLTREDLRRGRPPRS